MADIRLRPRFKREVDCPPAKVLRAIGEALDRPGATARGTLFESSAVLKVLPEETLFWSPRLELSFEPGNPGTHVHGLFGPHPTVWSMFVALYVAIGFTGAMGLTWGCAQWMLGDPPWALWSVPAATVLALVVWIVGRIGRRLGYDQVLALYQFVEEGLNACESSPLSDGETR